MTVAATATAALFPAAARAQNCAVCYSQAAGAGRHMIEALRSGILILAVPPILICAGIVLMARAKKNQFHFDEE
jgi:glyoxylate carboligase